NPEAELPDVLAGHHDDVAPLLPAVDVLFFVDDRVELALGAEGHQAQLAVGAPDRLREPDRVETRPPAGSRELAALRAPSADVEFSSCLVDLAEGRVPRDHLRDHCPDRLVLLE